ncbi:MAG: carboxy terminal-processing peptidase [Flavobacterium sp.]
MNNFMAFMKRNYKIIAFVAVLAVALLSFMPTKKAVNNDPDKDRLLLELLTFVVERGHYDPAKIDDNFSKGVYKQYIESIDPSKRFFIQSDIDEFAKYETQLDDQIVSRDLAFFSLTYDRLLKRIKAAEGFYKEIMAKPFDFNADEELNVDYEKQPFAKSESDLKKRWEKQMKLSVLSSITDKQKVEEDKKKKDPAYKVKDFATLEKESREASLASLNQYFDFIDELKRDEWFSVYINAIAERFDPHTFYFAPDDKEKFDTSMRGSLEGIGARLMKKNDYVEISELIPGGPAWRGKELEQGDLIMKVAQADGDAIDVAGMRLDDVVKKIKGPKGTIVKLTVKKVDGSIKVYAITREIVEIEETYAKSSIVNKDGKLYGIINLPKFYIDFENKDNRDAAKDVAAEVEKLKAAGVQGIVMDLRDNGGGALKTVVDMVGLFIPQGPVVQVKSTGKNKEVLSDTDSRVQWDGPLVVLVNNFSASASEIFAAAIQDYNRGLILGSRHTYGKGTVQNIIDMNQFVRENSMGDLGAIKITTQKYYRINGGSVQREGVYSDIIMPDRYAYIEMGERDSEFALPYDKIDGANYKSFKNNFEAIKAASKKRMAASEQFKLMDENAKFVNERKDESTYSLNYDKFKAELDKSEAFTKKFKALTEYNNTLKFTGLPQEQEAAKKDAALAEKKTRWYESLSKDIYVEEAVNILQDMKGGKPTGTVTMTSKDKAVKSK